MGDMEMVAVMGSSYGGWRGLGGIWRGLRLVVLPWGVREEGWGAG